MTNPEVHLTHDAPTAHFNEAQLDSAVEHSVMEGAAQDQAELTRVRAEKREDYDRMRAERIGHLIEAADRRSVVNRNKLQTITVHGESHEDKIPVVLH
jgi:hypothetical protein